MLRVHNLRLLITSAVCLAAAILLSQISGITALRSDQALAAGFHANIISDGIFEDNSAMPCIVINEVLSQSLFSSQQDGALVYFDGLWSGKAAEKALNATGFSAKSPNTRYDGWKGELSTCALTALLGIAIITLAAVYGTLRHKKTREELRALYALGVTRSTLRACAAIRWGVLAALFICAAVGVGSIFV